MSVFVAAQAHLIIRIYKANLYAVLHRNGSGSIRPKQILALDSSAWPELSWESGGIKFPFKRKACQVYRVKYGRGRIW